MSGGSGGGGKDQVVETMSDCAENRPEYMSPEQLVHELVHARRRIRDLEMIYDGAHRREEENATRVAELEHAIMNARNRMPRAVADDLLSVVTVPARLDPDGTAKGKTEIAGVFDTGPDGMNCIVADGANAQSFVIRELRTDCAPGFDPSVKTYTGETSYCGVARTFDDGWKAGVEAVATMIERSDAAWWGEDPDNQRRADWVRGVAPSQPDPPFIEWNAAIEAAAEVCDRESADSTYKYAGVVDKCSDAIRKLARK